RRGLRDLACLARLHAPPGSDREAVEPRQRGALLAERAGRAGVVARRPAGRHSGVRGGLGGGTLDGGGGDAPRRAGAGHHPVAAGAVPFAPGGVVRRQGDRGAAPGIRRARGEDQVTVAGKLDASRGVHWRRIVAAGALWALVYNFV